MDGTKYFEQRTEIIKQLKAAGMSEVSKRFPLITDKSDMLQCNHDRSIQIQDMRDMLRDVKAA